MSAQIDFLKRCKELGLHNGKLSNWLDEIESLRAQIAELEAENERLKIEARDACFGLNDYFGKQIAVLSNERAKLTCQRDEYKAVLENLLEVVDEPPERNCSCHIAPPCNYCVNWSGLREALSDARTAAKRETE